MRRHFVCQRIRLITRLIFILQALIQQAQLRLLQFQSLLHLRDRIVQAFNQIALQGRLNFQLDYPCFQFFHQSTIAAIQPDTINGRL